MNFGTKFENIITAIYSIQKAKIIINGENTQTLNIEKGVRQGCPLSPLLFILSLEVLLEQIRQNPEIKGLKTRNEEYKLQAFADDLAFIIEEPLESGQALLKELERYGSVAGLKINRQKTKFLPKNLTEPQITELERSLGLQTTRKIKYLGIWLTAHCKTIKENNYNKLLQQTKKDLEMWTKMHLSLLGRIASIKMSILPKFLYLFQTIPVKLEKTFFNDLNRTIAKFIWQGKKPRIKMKSLQDMKSRGGFGLPNWEIYYSAASLVWLKDWINLKNKRILAIEGHDLQRGWHAFLWETGHTKQQYFHRHLIRDSLINNWIKIKKKHYIKIPIWLSTMEAMIHPNNLDLNKMLKYKDLLDIHGKLKTLQDLQEQGLRIDWWAYLQLQNRYKQDIKEYGIYLKPQQLDKILLGPDKKNITQIYKYLLEVELEEEVVKGCMIAWGQNIGHNINLSDWENIWNRNYKLTKSATYKENAYKMFYRWHLPPSRLAKMYPKMSPACWKCKNKEGTYYHMWWSCPEAHKYWLKIKEWIQEITKEQLDLEPELFLLGIFKKTYAKNIKYLIIHILTAARMAFAQYWKQPCIPTEKLIIQKIMNCAEMDKLTLSLKDKETSGFYNIWEKWYKWIEQR